MEKQVSKQPRVGAKFGISSLFQKEDPDHVKLENSLIRAVSEFRSKEMQSVRLSSDFDLRLQNLLKDISLEEETALSRLSRNFIWNRNFQYSLSAALAVLVLAVTVGRFSSSNETGVAERSGTLSLGTDKEFIDLPSSARVDADLNSPYLSEISKNPQAKKTLSSLEQYFMEKGDYRTAQEIRQVLDSSNK
ncbi:hypothetical protein EHO59_07800 [Leptospira semungkisensis]|uniref:Uncharacterized protein n=1 Tax=Leptospira semungkisensis TaxID=2484985 RepID=A0A4R9G0I8_9LEPT|nr:hypothetical protein [Leptospira semungkisensis]TGK04754.1 hypothetical protein EHO59_07800 [Leptospira semungkisensis]